MNLESEINKKVYKHGINLVCATMASCHLANGTMMFVLLNLSFLGAYIFFFQKVFVVS